MRSSKSTSSKFLRCGRIVWVGAMIGVLVSCGDSGSPPVAVDSPGALGPSVVGHVEFTAVDSSRGDRPLPIDVWYPADPAGFDTGEVTFYPLAGPIGLDSNQARESVSPTRGRAHPLLVFSHGFGGIKLQSIGLMEALASHGFLVASVEHTGNAQSSSTDDFDTAAENRVPDVSFVIDTLFARSRDAGDLLYGSVVEGDVGVLGHSFGAMTSLGMAAGWAGAEPDLRVGAILPISAVIDGDLQSDEREGPNAGFSAAQLARIRVPVLLVGGTEDVNVPVGNNGIAFRQITNAPRVYRLDIRGANHNHFASVCTFGQLLFDLGIEKDGWPDVGAADLIEPFDATCGPGVFPIGEASRLVRLYAVSFFRRHLRGEVGYEQFLTTDFASREPAASLVVK